MPDNTLQIIVPSAKIPIMKAGLDIQYPKPEDWAGTEKEWYERVVMRLIEHAVRRGNRRLAKAAVEGGIFGE
jgi:hypothetical protein